MPLQYSIADCLVTGRTDATCLLCGLYVCEPSADAAHEAMARHITTAHPIGA